MKPYLSLLLPFYLFCAGSAQAAMISNGDFQSCTLSGWSLDTDGSGDPGPTGDFAIDNNAGDCRAVLSVDDGQSASAFFANTLYQELDLSMAAGQSLWLSFDWAFFGTDGDPQIGDFFNIALNDGLGNLYGADGQLGALLQSAMNGLSSYGSGTFSVQLDSSFYNLSGWFLDFSLQEGLAIGDGLFSSLAIDNVRLDAVSTQVPEPPLPALLLLGLLLMRRRTI
ncbi:hypothetical protein GCM10009092_12050 [Bowmanella denitrificans]|uniref:PEP-CTERM protein-sorting domain-containing protein n=1 Tax=Bowmanella denitrificans TaxID=366582 RepID=A0ABN0WY86_9ALTE